MARFVDGRVTFDRAVSREPLAVAADAARMYFEWCFGTFVPAFGGAGIVVGQKPAKHEDDHTPHTRCRAIVPARKNTRVAICVREASAAPAANLKRGFRTLDTNGPFWRFTFRYAHFLSVDRAKATWASWLLVQMEGGGVARL